MKRSNFIIAGILLSLLFASCSLTRVPYRQDIETTTLSIKNGDHTIPVSLTLPKGYSKVPVVIMLHGTGSNKDEAGNGFLMLAPMLAEKDIASARVDFPGSGESTDSYLLYSNSTAISDANAVADYLSNLAVIDKKRIGILGWSQGGTDALLSASDNNRFKSVATWAGALELKDLVSKEMREEAINKGFTYLSFSWRAALPLSQKWIDEVDNMDVLKSVEQISVPIASIHGTLDVTVPFSDSVNVQQKAVNSKSRLIPIQGANHTFNIFAGDLTTYYELTFQTVKWFRETL